VKKSEVVCVMPFSSWQVLLRVQRERGKCRAARWAFSSSSPEFEAAEVASAARAAPHRGLN